MIVYSIILPTDLSAQQPNHQGITVLFLASNPSATSRLALDREAREIEDWVKQAGGHDRIRLVTKWAVRPRDVIRGINEHEPDIVHFSGHGNTSDEIILCNSNGDPHPLDPSALGVLFEAMGENVRLVVFNACFSEPHARAVAEAVGCAVGMKDTVSDEAAIQFAGAFYGALSHNKSVKEAFDQGRALIKLEGLPDTEVPTLLTTKRVDPKTMQLFSINHGQREVSARSHQAPDLLVADSYWRGTISQESPSIQMAADLLVVSRNGKGFRGELSFMHQRDYVKWTVEGTVISQRIEWKTKERLDGPSMRTEPAVYVGGISANERSMSGTFSSPRYSGTFNLARVDENNSTTLQRSNLGMEHISVLVAGSIRPHVALDINRFASEAAAWPLLEELHFTTPLETDAKHLDPPLTEGLEIRYEEGDPLGLAAAKLLRDHLHGKFGRPPRYFDAASARLRSVSQLVPAYRKGVPEGRVRIMMCFDW